MEKIKHCNGTKKRWIKSSQQWKQCYESSREHLSPFFQKLMGKLHHAAMGIPAGKGLMIPLNKNLAKQPHKVRFWQNSLECHVLLLWKMLLIDALKAPTHAQELVTGEANYVSLVDDSGEGVGGIWLSGKKKLRATIWIAEWPNKIRNNIKTEANPDGKITNIDLELAGNVIEWLVLEGMQVKLQHSHVEILSDNSPSVSWIDRWASKSNGPPGRLLCILALCQWMAQASPLAP